MNDGQLDRKIEELREMMIEFGLANGLLHPDTIRISQKLDQFVSLKIQNSLMKDLQGIKTIN